MKATEYKALWVQTSVHPPSHIESPVLPFALKVGVLLLLKGARGYPTCGGGVMWSSGNSGQGRVPTRPLSHPPVGPGVWVALEAESE